MRVKREMILDKLQEELKTKVKILENKINFEFDFFFKEDELNYYRKQQENVVSKLQTDQQVYLFLRKFLIIFIQYRINIIQQIFIK